jgi:hypothetical protein
MENPRFFIQTLSEKNMTRLHLPQVTLMAISMNPDAAAKTLAHCASLVDFGDIRLLSPHPPSFPFPGTRVPIYRMSYLQYSYFCIRYLHCFFETSHVLCVQEDGFVLNPEQWTDEFLNCDYVGAPWPQEHVHWKANSVGNGGFCLKSREFTRWTARFAPLWNWKLNEDLFCCDYLYSILRYQKMRFASPSLAGRFSMELPLEKGAPLDFNRSFGFHGRYTKEHRRIAENIQNKAVAPFDRPATARPPGMKKWMYYLGWPGATLLRFKK